MKYAVSLIAAVVALGGISARADQTEPEVNLAWLHPVTGSSVRDDRADAHRNTALIKEEEFASPETVAAIENNREDRERTVVIDR